MPHDPARVEDARAWLRKAQLDLLAAAHLLTARPPLLGTAAFHCQQAAEKSLKAFLAWHDEPFRKTHNLEELGGQAITIDRALKQPIERATILTEYSWRFRYPGEPEQPQRKEVEDALARARSVFEAVLARLPKDARPPKS